MSENKIIISGVGNGCSNAINDLIDSNIDDVEYISINRDAYVLDMSKAETKIQIGDSFYGNDENRSPELGKRFVRTSKNKIAEAIQNADMLMIVACLGGGIGTGAACAVADIAKELNVFTVALVTKPFYFETRQKRITAENGIDELKSLADSVIVIPNNGLFAGTKEPVPAREAFLLSDNMITASVKALIEPLSKDGVINLCFDDIPTTFKNAGTTHIALGHSTGKNKAYEAVISIITSPFFETPISRAGRLLLNVVLSPDSDSVEVDYVSRFISDAAREDADMIFGFAFDDDWHDEIKVSVIATDFK